MSGLEFPHYMSTRITSMSFGDNSWVADVALPRSYDSPGHEGQAYPVLIALDGDEIFELIVGLVRFLANGPYANWEIPELIVVGIRSSNRIRDLTFAASTKGYDGSPDARLHESGGGRRFLDAIDKQLLPQLRAAFRTLPHRVLAGHSLGGLFALNVFCNRPDIFQGWIAIDPSLWWADEVLTASLRDKVSDPQPRTRSLYIAEAGIRLFSAGDPAHFSNSVNRFVTALGESGGYLRHDLFAQEDHVSILVKGIHAGLRHIYGCGDGQLNDVIGSANRFADVAARLGIQLQPPETLLRRLATIAEVVLRDEELTRRVLNEAKIT